MARVAVITGASRGIGAATAMVLAERGFRVVVNYRSSAEQADGVVRDVAAAGGEAVAIRADVTVPDDVTAMVDQTNQKWGRVDVVVHNALIPFDVTSFADLSWEQLGGKLDRELRAAFVITKAVVPGMISRGYGRLVYLSTGLSRRPRRDDYGGHRQGGAGSVCPVHRTRGPKLRTLSRSHRPVFAPMVPRLKRRPEFAAWQPDFDNISVKLSSDLLREI